MADPGTLIIAATAVSAAASLAGGVAAFQQGRFQAEVADRNAQLAEQRAQLEAQNLRRDHRRRRSLAVAQFAAAGVAMEGTPLNIIAEEAGEAERQAQLIRFGGSVERAEHLVRGRAAATSGTLSLLGGAAQAGSTIFGGIEDFRSISPPRIET